MTDLIEGLGQKHLIRITADGKTTVATLKHPYYLPDEQRWIPAGSLSPGDRLQRADGSTAVVEAVSQYTVLRGRVHNLTVATAHTYYAGAEPVLVHNATGCEGGGAEKPSTLSPGPHAGEGTPVSRTNRRPTASEQRSVDKEMADRGCHTCGTKDPGTRSGKAVADHQDATALNTGRKPQRFYPHCLPCSRRQAGEVRAEAERRRKAEALRRNRGK